MEPRDRDQFDPLLDGALRQYGSVEPRTGLEGRVLANLAAEAGRPQNRAWWVWALAGTGIAVLVVGIWFGHRSGVSPRTEVDRRAPHEVIIPSTPLPVEQEVSKHRGLRPNRSHRPRSVTVAEGPKLQQFPSPRPRSEQEMMLVEYVERYPQEAILIANEQDEFQEAIMQAERDIEKGSSSDQQKR